METMIATPHESVLPNRTVTLLHQLALSYATEAFPTRNLVDLLEPEILFALNALPPRSRTATHLSSRIGVSLSAITKALTRLHHHGVLTALSPVLTLTPQGKRHALAVQSTTHWLMANLPKFKHKTLCDLHTLLSQLHQERLHIFRLPSDSEDRHPTNGHPPLGQLLPMQKTTAPLAPSPRKQRRACHQS